MKTSTLQKFNCYMCDGDNCNASLDEKPYCEESIFCWKSTVRQPDGTTRNSRGCITNRDQVPLYCNKHLELSGNNSTSVSISGKGKFRTECCQKELCNGGPFPVLYDPTDEKRMSVIKITLAVIGPILALSLIVGAIFFYYRSYRSRTRRGTKPSCKKHNHYQQQQQLIETGMDHQCMPSGFLSNATGGNSCSGAGTSYSHELRATAAGDSTLKEYLEGQSLTSGSGSGLPLLVQRTLAKQVALAECLSNSGSGSFGPAPHREVWRGIWHGENVAVKIYFSRDEAMWARETEVYSQLLPSRHDNILGYVGSDMTSRASCTQLWLVTHYHPLGSLHTYLRQRTQPFSYHDMFNVCLSIANGLLYLHTEIHGTRGKPAMAHRNLNSKNLLVKNNGACVIADLANAVTQDRLVQDKTNILDTVKLSSKRYISPELLEQTNDPQCLESFRRSDIYSLGLIFWEVCRRCISNGVALDYAAPYSEWLANANQEPSIEEMRKLVVADQRRPPIPNRWHSDSTLAGMGAMMKECWHTKAAARLPILRVKKTLVKLASNNPDVNLPLD
ncbi:activin receptor type-1 isoform X2 [Phymastichus coffea]|uniref:activin receptor type-1 isoform X2 n=1 Tax=Phymastichus coffea TaxID=108790 RepID=UPI00273C03FE|nr:activin receptor type-1 isoform X2 [Phymastichus coffea]